MHLCGGGQIIERHYKYAAADTIKVLIALFIKRIQKHKYTNIQLHKYTNTQIHKYTNTQIYNFTNMKPRTQSKFSLLYSSTRLLLLLQALFVHISFL